QRMPDLRQREIARMPVVNAAGSYIPISIVPEINILAEVDSKLFPVICSIELMVQESLSSGSG
ncbi:MAG: hypothetical protein PHD55_08170, partial [Methanoregula sp.]|nr:hypothetical protein [Methanoregula sp.]